MRLDKLIEALQEIKGSGEWEKLARLSGVNYFTVARIARRKIANPGIGTVEKLTAALRKLKQAA
ncbi:hypothetical protein M8A51_25670 [Schlegelella sp. S2-27]|uniref:HTH cro/C1-type domain-containing protein n=1 Tax=Caldimonas mangrovi TaxID=2944811 RepID=A0ABT0YVZ1_9BURK|nr:hypothetical protein [Caldimonas mangrovi]MCM5682926.1 hypothetical protein [Caldimonas mangrovi]